jgi:hypothetical protein
MKLIQKTSEVFKELLPLVEKQLCKVISPEQAMIALCLEANMDIDEIASIEWTAESLALALQSCKAIVALPSVIAVAVFESSIVPEGTEEGTYDELVKHKGELWYIHRHDADPQPSNPHAHNYEKGLKLHLGNGDLYHGTKLVGRLPQKTFLQLREKVKHVELPVLSI